MDRGLRHSAGRSDQTHRARHGRCPSANGATFSVLSLCFAAPVVEHPSLLCTRGDPKSAPSMTFQLILAVGFLALSVLMSAPALLYRFAAARSLLIANMTVVGGGLLASWWAQEWAGWLTAALFILLVTTPLTLQRGVARAMQTGQLRRAARLQWWGAFLHPSPQMRFGLALTRARTSTGPMVRRPP